MTASLLLLCRFWLTTLTFQTQRMRSFLQKHTSLLQRCCNVLLNPCSTPGSHLNQQVCDQYPYGLDFSSAMGNLRVLYYYLQGRNQLTCRWACRCYIAGNTSYHADSQEHGGCDRDPCHREYLHCFRYGNCHCKCYI